MDKITKKKHEVELLKAAAVPKSRLSAEEKQLSCNLSAQKYYYKNREAILAKAKAKRAAKQQNTINQQQQTPIEV